MKQFIIFLFILSLASTAGAQRVLIRHSNDVNQKRVLIAYYSPEDHVQKLAQAIHDNIDADLFEIMTRSNAYPKEHEAMLEQAAQEFEDGFLPELPLKLGSMEKYDIIFVGSPVWNGHLPPAVSSFFKDYNLKGKKVIPFFSFDEDSDSSVLAETTAQCEGCLLTEKGFVTQKDDITGLESWLDEIDFDTLSADESR